jgi:hypothetical protein
MADDQVGLRTEGAARELPLWTKLFTAFRVALDPKKLLLAAAGIVAMAIGWWILSAVFFAAWQTPPKWDDYKDENNVAASWKSFKEARNRWNLRYKMAGPVPDSPKDAVKYDAADVADSPEEYEQIGAQENLIRQQTSLRRSKVEVLQESKTGAPYFQVGGHTIRFDPAGEEKPAALVKSLSEQGLDPTKLATGSFNAETKTLTLGNTKVKLPDPDQWEQFRKELVNSKQLSDIEQEIREGRRANAEAARKALLLVREDGVRFKPAGELRTLPWSEYRGPNPYLMLTGRAGEAGGDTVRALPWEQGHFFDWLLGDEIPVLLEPLVKFLRPVLYMLHPAAGGLNRLYLILVILWGLAVWAVFGGAITRMAAVQVARSNEKVGMGDAVRFAWARFQSFFSAPLLPLVFITILTVLLWLYGLVEQNIPIFGDIVMAGLLLPLALILGLIIAVVLVGLVGWPLMYATISAEGSDSFDGISRSYSYVYQAPWHYLWYALVSLAYGAVLIFFVGLMGSLITYTTKWGMSLAPTWEKREPSYLFALAPESFGWRDLLLYQSPNAAMVEVVRPNGLVAKEREVRFTDNYSFSLWNRIGAFLVAIWLTLLLLLVVGFGYSFFWTASTIIYLLMRRRVDDTDMDEIHLEEETEEPYTPPPPAAAPDKPGITPLTMVEPPALKTPAPSPPVESLRTPEPPAPPQADQPAGSAGGAGVPSEASPSAGIIPPPPEPPGSPPDNGPA